MLLNNNNVYVLYNIFNIISGKSHKNKGKTPKNKKYTKDQIGLPENFRHVQHIGWDPDRGFDLGQIKDPQLNKFFAKVRYIFSVDLIVQKTVQFFIKNII